MFAHKTIGIGLGSFMLAVLPLSAQACGVFGTDPCSLIRGDVGRIMAPVQRTVLTPVLQAAVVVAATGGAVAIAGPIGAPVGATFGNGVNDLFAGKGGDAQQAPQQQAAMGGKCSHEVAGEFPLNGPAPIGSACSVRLSNGKELGGKVIP